LLPTIASKPAVGASLNLNTALCESISSPARRDSKAPLLATTAHEEKRAWAARSPRASLTGTARFK